MEFKVRVENGDVFINDEFVDQLCFDADAIGSAVANYIKDVYDDDECDEFDGDKVDESNNNRVTPRCGITYCAPSILRVDRHRKSIID